MIDLDDGGLRRIAIPEEYSPGSLLRVLFLQGYEEGYYKFGEKRKEFLAVNEAHHTKGIISTDSRDDRGNAYIRGWDLGVAQRAFEVINTMN